MPKNLQETLHFYISKLTKTTNNDLPSPENHQFSPENLHSRSLNHSKSSWFFSGCRYPRTPSFAHGRKSDPQNGTFSNFNTLFEDSGEISGEKYDPQNEEPCNFNTLFEDSGIKSDSGEVSLQNINQRNQDFTLFNNTPFEECDEISGKTSNSSKISSYPQRENRCNFNTPCEDSGKKSNSCKQTDPQRDILCNFKTNFEGSSKFSGRKSESQDTTICNLSSPFEDSSEFSGRISPEFTTDSCSFSSGLSSSEGHQSGARRFFFSPEKSSSILSALPDKFSGVAFPAFSPDPYSDFRGSMQEMVDFRLAMGEVLDWSFLEELLLSYLRLNEKEMHKYIVGAFADLMVSFGRVTG
ncbi:hypothetical protein AMTRI_Chr05g64760 [Amborella trichopoda]